MIPIRKILTEEMTDMSQVSKTHTNLTSLCKYSYTLIYSSSYSTPATCFRPSSLALFQEIWDWCQVEVALAGLALLVHFTFQLI